MYGKRLLCAVPADQAGRAAAPAARLYAAKSAATAVLLAAGWIAFLGHDAGHRQIFGTRRANGLLGLVLGNLLIGVSYTWWVGKHNRHHSNPNHTDLDPDITIGALAFTA